MFYSAPAIKLYHLQGFYYDFAFYRLFHLFAVHASPSLPYQFSCSRPNVSRPLSSLPNVIITIAPSTHTSRGATLSKMIPKNDSFPPLFSFPTPPLPVNPDMGASEAHPAGSGGATTEIDFGAFKS